MDLAGELGLQAPRSGRDRHRTAHRGPIFKRPRAPHDRLTVTRCSSASTERTSLGLRSSTPPVQGARCVHCDGTLRTLPRRDCCAGHRELYWMARISFFMITATSTVSTRSSRPSFDTEIGRLPTEQRGQQPPLSGRRRRDARPGAAQLRRRQPRPTLAPWATLPSVRFASDDDGCDDDAEYGGPRTPAVHCVDRVGSALRSARRRGTRTGRARCSSQRWSTGHGVAPADGPSARPAARSQCGGACMRAMRTGGDVVELVNTAQRSVPRRIVAIIDVSGSMETYARAYLHLARPLALRRNAEVFAFSTALSRITTAVRTRSPAEAIDQLGDSVGDRFSGTRLASSLGKLLHHRTWSTLVRGLGRRHLLGRMGQRRSRRDGSPDATPRTPRPIGSCG